MNKAVAATKEDYGTDNQRGGSAVHLQAEHPENTLGREKNKAKGKSGEAREINLALDNLKAQFIKHYQRISAPEAYMPIISVFIYFAFPSTYRYHVCATILLYRGISIPTVQKILGHQNVKTTQIYSAVTDMTIEREIKRSNRKKI